MVSTAALIAALQGQFAAARQGQGGGSTAGLPGLLSSGTAENGSGINALTSGGISGGGVPTTATTGQSIASGVGGEAALSDPLTQQVLRSLGREPGEQPERPNVPGGDLNSLLSVLGGPTAIAGILGSLVASTELGLPPATSINSLIESSDRDSNIGISPQVGPTVNSVNTVRSGQFSRQFNPAGGFEREGRDPGRIDRGQRVGRTRNSVNSIRSGL